MDWKWGGWGVYQSLRIIFLVIIWLDLISIEWIIIQPLYTVHKYISIRQTFISLNYCEFRHITGHNYLDGQIIIFQIIMDDVNDFFL